MSHSKDDVFNIVKEALVDLFGTPEDDITPTSNLYTDLDIDSIDAVDLIVRLKEKTGKKPDVEAFKNARTVEDVVNTIHVLIND